jgi:hypothetical protein
VSWLGGVAVVFLIVYVFKKLKPKKKQKLPKPVYQKNTLKTEFLKLDNLVKLNKKDKKELRKREIYNM